MMGIVSTSSLLVGITSSGSTHNTIIITGISEIVAAFSIGARLPLIAAYFSRLDNLVMIISVSSLIFLAILGSISAYVGGASMKISTIRVTFLGVLAMALTAGVSSLFGTAV